ncbi:MULTISPECIES: nuclear transport factor 2 family protein [Sphingobacterium]|uniref:nuclear transport factor 2 family protein n=1 Tax=Sphingobacterium TaxID=28453 RepID=UPI00257E309B|nr:MULTISPECIES: nuclear transport factor 2 family protein [Sphingobacterium]
MNTLDNFNQPADLAQHWVDAWNQHDLDTIMRHYSEDIDFRSPIIQKMGVNTAGNINNKEELKAYFKSALEKYPELHFELYHILTGVNSMVIFYKSVNDSLSAEYMELDVHGKICKVSAHYKGL